jgi:hypothetical protein
VGLHSSIDGDSRENIVIGLKRALQKKFLVEIEPVQHVSVHVDGGSLWLRVDAIAVAWSCMSVV